MNDVIDERRGATSASNAEADKLCPGRFQAQKGIPDPPRSVDSKHGDAIHAALANASGNGAELRALTLEQREVFEQCRAIEKKIITQLFLTNPVKMWREQRVWVKVPKLANDFAITYEHSGQADLVVRAGPQALIVDYKSLYGDFSESPKNQQLRDLSVLVRGWLIVSEVATVIIQPKVTHDPQIALYEKPDLDRAEAEMFDRVRKSNDPASPRIPGEVQCKWCKAAKAGKCKEYLEWASRLTPALAFASKKFMVDWTPQERGLVAAQVPLAKKLIEDIEAFLKDCLTKDPDGVEGYCLSNGATRETITNPQALFDRFLAIGGKPEQFMPCVNVAKGKLKEAVSEVVNEIGRDLDKRMGELLDGIVEKKQNAPSLKKK